MSPINIQTERLLPLKELPDYLASRGFGKRVSMRAVRRWVREGSHGARLEAVVIDRVILTSLEAVQRWVDAQSAASDLTGSASVATPSAPVAAPTTSEHEASMHLLTEHRVMPTELDRLVHTLDHPESARAFAAGMLFRVGLRTPEDARRKGLDGLLAIPGLGVKSKSVVRSLWAALERSVTGTA